MATSPSFCDQCGARLSGDVRFCEACGAPVTGTPMAESSTAASVPQQPARQFEKTPETSTRGTTRTAAHSLLWAAPVALCVAAVASWLWLQSPQAGPTPPSTAAPLAPTTQQSTATAVVDNPESAPTTSANGIPDQLPAEVLDAESTASDPVAVEYRAARDRYDRAFHAYTVLITEGGSGNVIEARDEYAAAYEDLKRIEAAHPEYAK